jgi:hypothetical protein
MFRLPSTVSRALETTGERYSSRAGTVTVPAADGENLRSSLVSGVALASNWAAASVALPW